MSVAYCNCQLLTGNPVCGNKVTTLWQTYKNCENLTGSPVCGELVTDMHNAYHNCKKLTGSPVVGNNVTDMSNAYQNCFNLTGSPVCGPNVIDMSYAYHNCKNLYGDMYVRSYFVDNVEGCFLYRNNSRRLNIYIPANAPTTATFFKSDSGLIDGITWTNSGTNFYNTAYNIYVYPTLQGPVYGTVNYSVSKANGATYGFPYNASTGYYTSENQGVASSVSLCTVTVNNPNNDTVIMELIHSGEYGSDFGLISELNKTLTLYTGDQSDIINVYKEISTHSDKVQVLNLGKINGTFQVKYKKDSSVNSGLDTFKFRLITVK
jgi:hypothetical protein